MSGAAPRSRNAVRMLYAIEACTGESGGGRWPWLKEYVVAIVVHLGIDEGVFTTYDKAPSLFAFHGIKRFAMTSQEANLDIADFFDRGYIQKMLLNTWYYASISAVRISDAGREVLRERLTDEDRKAPFNMPELYWRYGYVVVLCLMTGWILASAYILREQLVDLYRSYAHSRKKPGPL